MSRDTKGLLFPLPPIESMREVNDTGTAFLIGVDVEVLQTCSSKSKEKTTFWHSVHLTFFPLPVFELLETLEEQDENEESKPEPHSATVNIDPKSEKLSVSELKPDWLSSLGFFSGAPAGDPGRIETLSESETSEDLFSLFTLDLGVDVTVGSIILHLCLFK